jgi:molybdate transport system substrate-binding protein
MKLRVHCAACALGLLSSAAQTAELTLAVASNFTPAMHEIALRFERETGHKVRTVSGSSGKFHAQIRNGAPFHAFFSADAEKPLRLEQEGLAVPGTRFTYAIGRLALWSPRPSFVDNAGRVLHQGAFGRLAIANPLHAPYGAAALEVLQRLGLADRLRGKLAQGENVAQAYQFVDSGNAELGFVALSQVVESGAIKRGSAWTVPASMHRSIRQDAVLLKPADSETGAAAAARELLDYMRGATARSIVAAHGYETGAGQ